MENMRRIRYLGHSGFEIEIDDAIIYIDICTRNKISGHDRLIPDALDISSIKKADLLFVTHEHEGHCDPAALKEIAERTYASVIGPKPALAKVDVSNRLKVDVRTGDRFTVKGIDVEVVKAVHPQSVYPVGYVIKKGDFAVYHAGDTYSYVGMHEIKAGVAMLPIGGIDTMDAFDAGNACKEIRPTYAIPMHYNTFEKIKQDAKEFESAVGERTKAVILRVGEEVRFK
jgi:L-ascorbate metabolism protein UlaG (beta-lactamase superfamily)